VSRSEGEESSNVRYVPRKDIRRKSSLRRQFDDDGNTGIDLHISVSYRTLVFAFVTFDVIRHVTDTIAGVF